MICLIPSQAPERSHWSLPRFSGPTELCARSMVYSQNEHGHAWVRLVGLSLTLTIRNNARGQNRFPNAQGTLPGPLYLLCDVTDDVRRRHIEGRAEIEQGAQARTFLAVLDIVKKSAAISASEGQLILGQGLSDS